MLSHYLTLVSFSLPHWGKVFEPLSGGAKITPRTLAKQIDKLIKNKEATAASVSDKRCFTAGKSQQKPWEVAVHQGNEVMNTQWADYKRHNYENKQSLNYWIRVNYQKRRIKLQFWLSCMFQLCESTSLLKSNEVLTRTLRKKMREKWCLRNLILFP